MSLCCSSSSWCLLFFVTFTSVTFCICMSVYVSVTSTDAKLLYVEFFISLTHCLIPNESLHSDQHSTFKINVHFTWQKLLDLNYNKLLNKNVAIDAQSSIFRKERTEKKEKNNWMNENRIWIYLKNIMYAHYVCTTEKTK